MKKPALYSILLHVIVLVILLVGIPFTERKVPAQEQPFMVEFEKVGPERLSPILAPQASIEDKKAPPKPTPKPKEEPKVEPEAPKPEPEQAKPEEAKPEAPKPVEPAAPKPEPEPKPAEPVVEATNVKESDDPDDLEEDIDGILEPHPKKKVEPEKKVEPKKPAEPKKEVKKDPKKDKGKKEVKNTKAVVNLKPKKSAPKPLSTAKEKSVDDLVDSLIDDTINESSDAGRRGAPAQAVGSVITGTDIDAIRQKIAKCWLIPAGVEGAKDLAVDIRMDLAKDGTVTKAEIMNKERMADPTFRAAAESAQRAALDPACQPLPLSPEKCEKWKQLTFRFNPRDMY